MFNDFLVAALSISTIGKKFTEQIALICLSVFKGMVYGIIVCMFNALKAYLLK
jgi:hypothetical protein